MYPIVYFDALRLKIRDEGTVRNKAVYLALGIDATGRKDVLGLWIEHTESAKFWLKVFNDLKQGGVADILIASRKPSRRCSQKPRYRPASCT
jgi:transposase-like protein